MTVPTLNVQRGIEVPRRTIDISPDQYHRDCAKLGSNLVDHCLASETQLDMLLTAARGGFTPTEYVAKVLGMGAKRIRVLGLQTYGLTGNGLTGEREIGQLPDLAELTGLNVAFVDELNDGGGTAEFVDELCERANVGRLVVATVYQKPRTKRPSDVIVHTVPSEAWLNFPSDLHPVDPRAAQVVR